MSESVDDDVLRMRAIEILAKTMTDMGFIDEDVASYRNNPDDGDDGVATEAVHRALTAIGNTVQEQGWRDIADAPKGCLIDIWARRSDGSGFRWTDCYYDKICDEWRTTGSSGHLVSIKARNVTHFRLPPDPPVEGGGA